MPGVVADVLMIRTMPCADIRHMSSHTHVLPLSARFPLTGAVEVCRRCAPV